jgi:hypothetical protein
MFNRSLATVDDRINNLSRSFTALLTAQTHTILDGIKLLSERGALPEKMFELKIACDGLAKRMQQLTELTHPEAVHALQQDIFITVRLLKNKIRPILETTRSNADQIFKTHEETFLKDEVMLRMTKALTGKSNIRYSASIAAAIKARQEPSVSLETRQAISQLTGSYQKVLDLDEFKEVLNRNESSLEFTWQAIIQADGKFLTIADLSELANTSPPTAEQKAAQQILELIHHKLILPNDLEHKIKKLEDDLDRLHLVIRESKHVKVMPVSGERVEESLAMARAVYNSFRNVEVGKLEEMMTQDYLRQTMKAPKKTSTEISAWIKQRDSQFKLFIDDANKIIEKIETVVHGEVSVTNKTSWLGRLFFSKKNENKVLPVSEKKTPTKP